MAKLSVETFLAALTVASISAGCSKAAEQRAAPEPASSAQSQAVAPGAVAQPAPTTATDSLGAVDAGIERQKAAAPRAKPSANAACGAGTCSDEMKK